MDEPAKDFSSAFLVGNGRVGGLLHLERWDGTRFTCFTGTKEKYKILFWSGGCSTSSAGMVRALLALLALKRRVQILTL
jgi:hypothetical protein